VAQLTSVSVVLERALHCSVVHDFASVSMRDKSALLHITVPSLELSLLLIPILNGHFCENPLFDIKTLHNRIRF
jgi:hypothetical protein